MRHDDLRRRSSRGSLNPKACSLRLQECSSALTAQHCERGQRTGLSARLREHRHRVGCTLHRPSGARIEYVRVPDPILHDEASRVPARSECTRVKGYSGRGRAHVVVGLDTDAPWLPVTPRRANRNVSAEVDETADARRDPLYERNGAVDGILLTDAAEVDLHMRAHPQHRSTPFDLVPADQLAHLLDLLLGRNAIATVECPDCPQHSGSDVECAVGQYSELFSELQEVRRLLIHRDG